MIIEKNKRAMFDCWCNLL